MIWTMNIVKHADEAQTMGQAVIEELHIQMTSVFDQPKLFFILAKAHEAQPNSIDW